MLKFIKHHLETIAGIEIFPMISFIIFLGFFAVMAYWVAKSDQRHMDELSNIPLD